MKAIYLTIGLLFSLSIFAQTEISGKLTDTKGLSIIGANIVIEGSYDGVSSDIDGNFSFKTYETGQQTLKISYLGFITIEKSIELTGKPLQFEFELKEDLKTLETVVISAGSFEASDEKKAVILSSIDIVTTSSADGDVYGALNTLPGTQKVGEEGQLFVRGGAGHETKTYIDGMLVHKPYGSKVPDIPARGRFSPMLFKGTMFSTGGYSAEYGQALSSALILETEGLAKETMSNLSLMAIGGGIGHTQRWENTSLSVNFDYNNMKPLFKVLGTDTEWITDPKGYGASTVFRQKTSKTGLFKFMGNASQNEVSFFRKNLNDLSKKDIFGLKNNNVYLNSTYKDIIGKDWSLRVGSSYTYNIDYLNQNESKLENEQQGLQTRATVSKFMGNVFKVKGGAEYSFNKNSIKKFDTENNSFKTGFNKSYGAAFAEVDVYFSKNFVARSGTRAEYDSRLGKMNIAQRVSLAYKFNKHSQASLAVGQFYQTPEDEYLLVKPEFKYERADHYILNYQIMRNDRIFRAEAYYKNYKNLVKYEENTDYNPELYNNDGNGFARGIDLFYKDKKSIKNGEFWVSYSFLDTQRDYLNFPEQARPTFASKHNLSIVYKHYVPKLKTLFGATYNASSSRPFENPNKVGFNESKTKPYNDIALSASYLTNIKGHFTIFYASISNPFGFKNEFGKNYATTPDTEGIFYGETVKPPYKRFLFAAVFISFNYKKNKKAEKNKL